MVSQIGSCPHRSYSMSFYYVNSISFCLHVMFNIDCVLGTIRSLVSAECCSSLTSTTTSACPLSISRSTTLTKAWSTRSLRHISTSSEFLPYQIISIPFILIQIPRSLTMSTYAAVKIIKMRGFFNQHGFLKFKFCLIE